ncbi:MAG: PAS domain-containing sensor histidine kinase [Pedobacter sp.]
MNDNIANILALTTNLSDEVYFIYNVDERKLEHLNPAFESITDLHTEQVLQNPRLLFKIIHKEDHSYLRNKIQYIVEDKEPSTVSFRVIRKDGQQRWIILNIYPILSDDTVHYLSGNGEDDTDRRASLMTIEKVRAWKSASLEILSHDLREPVGTIKMLASIIARRLPDNPQIIKLTSMIEEIAQKNIYLIQTLLNGDSVVSEEAEIKKERLDIVWELRQAIAMYIEAQDNLQKHITFSHSQEKIYADIDNMKYLQIVSNLVSNAVKFTDDQGHICIHLELLENTFLLTVKDDGIGIPKKLHPFIFDKYTEAGRTGVDGQKSVGLGMWIVKRLVEEHNGKVWFKSKERCGSTFYVEIPTGHKS